MYLNTFKNPKKDYFSALGDKVKWNNSFHLTRAKNKLEFFKENNCFYENFKSELVEI